MDPETNTKKERKRKKRRKKHYILRLVILIAIMVGIFFLLRSPLFTIHSITVDGNERYSDAEIINMTEVKIGDNLFKTKTGSMKKALKNDPYFNSVKVSRKLPDTLVITVSEKRALIAAEVSGGFAIIDSESRVLEISDSTRGSTLITGLTFEECEPGKIAVSSDETLFSRTKELMEVIENSGLYFKKINVSLTEDRLYVYDDLYFIGDRESLIKNTDEMKSVLYKLNQQSITRGELKIGNEGYVSYDPVTD